jgi:hypothetical protein
VNSIWVVVAETVAVEPHETPLLPTRPSATFLKAAIAEVESLGNYVTLSFVELIRIEPDRTLEVTLAA